MEVSVSVFVSVSVSGSGSVPVSLPLSLSLSLSLLPLSPSLPPSLSLSSSPLSLSRSSSNGQAPPRRQRALGPWRHGGALSPPSTRDGYRSNSSQLRQSRPDSGLSLSHLSGKRLETFEMFRSHSGARPQTRQLARCPWGHGGGLSQQSLPRASPPPPAVPVLLQKSMSLKYEPSSEPLHISANYNRPRPRASLPPPFASGGGLGFRG